MHRSRPYLLLLLLGLCLVASGCEWAGFGERDLRKKVAGEVDEMILNRQHQRLLAEQDGQEGKEVSVVLELIEFPVSQWNVMFPPETAEQSGDFLRREVQILLETEEARLREQIVLRARPGRESVVSSLRKGQNPSGSILKLEPTDLNPPNLSLDVHLQLFGMDAENSEAEEGGDKVAQRKRSADFSARVTTKNAHYAFLGTLDREGGEDDPSNESTILLLFLRADFF